MKRFLNLNMHSLNRISEVEEQQQPDISALIENANLTLNTHFRNIFYKMNFKPETNLTGKEGLKEFLLKRKAVDYKGRIDMHIMEEFYKHYKLEKKDGEDPEVKEKAKVLFEIFGNVIGGIEKIELEGKIKIKGKEKHPQKRRLFDENPHLQKAVDEKVNELKNVLTVISMQVKALVGKVLGIEKWVNQWKDYEKAQQQYKEIMDKQNPAKKPNHSLEPPKMENDEIFADITDQQPDAQLLDNDLKRISPDLLNSETLVANDNQDASGKPQDAPTIIKEPKTADATNILKKLDTTPSENLVPNTNQEATTAVEINLATSKTEPDQTTSKESSILDTKKEDFNQIDGSKNLPNVNDFLAKNSIPENLNGIPERKTG